VKPREAPLAEDDGALRVYTAAEFLRMTKPIESRIAGLPVPNIGFVCLTGNTGHCKTTLAALMQVRISSGAAFAGRTTTRSPVLVLAGENPEDYAMHLRATYQDVGEPWGEQVLVVPGVFDFVNYGDRLAELALRVGRPHDVREFGIVFVDTSAAYNLRTTEENNNVEMLAHARSLRELGNVLPGRPTVVVLCHPTKAAGRESLVPRGGGAFLNECDANLTVWRDDNIVTLHWHGKIRGQAFDPVRFELEGIRLDGVVDSHGNPISTSIVRHLPDEQAEAKLRKLIDDDGVLLHVLLKHPRKSLRELAKLCGWTDGVMQPQFGRVRRRLLAMERDNLVQCDRAGQWTVTAAGQREEKALSGGCSGVRTDDAAF
jgi:hypothetical protein